MTLTLTTHHSPLASRSPITHSLATHSPTPHASQLSRTDMTLGTGVERHKREVAEQGRLVETVNAQAAEIERLRREVAVLRHKGGQVLAA